jgi:hypothetical protein
MVCSWSWSCVIQDQFYRTHHSSLSETCVYLMGAPALSLTFPVSYVVQYFSCDRFSHTMIYCLRLFQNVSFCEQLQQFSHYMINYLWMFQNVTFWEQLQQTDTDHYNIRRIHTLWNYYQIPKLLSCLYSMMLMIKMNKRIFLWVCKDLKHGLFLRMKNINYMW